MSEKNKIYKEEKTKNIKLFPQKIYRLNKNNQINAINFFNQTTSVKEKYKYTKKIIGEGSFGRVLLVLI